MVTGCDASLCSGQEHPSGIRTVGSPETERYGTLVGMGYGTQGIGCVLGVASPCFDCDLELIAEVCGDVFRE
jgi:hypothetical protein